MVLDEQLFILLSFKQQNNADVTTNLNQQSCKVSNFYFIISLNIIFIIPTIDGPTNVNGIKDKLSHNPF